MMNKEFLYKGHRFNIKVEFNTRAIRGDIGKSLVWDTITINCMDHDNYYHKTEVLHEDLIRSVIAEEAAAKRFIDKKLDNSVENQELADLGFK